MAEQAIDAPAVEDKITDPEESKSVADQEPAKEDTIGDLLDISDEPKEPVKEVRMVPESVLIQVKKELRDLKRSVDNGATNKEVTADIKELAEKHNVDEDFITELVATIKHQTKSEVEETLSNEMKPIKEKDRLEKIDRVFNEHFDKTISQMPEFDGIVNKDVIKTLSLDPANKNKTFQQLIETAYGHLVTGRKTMETSKPGQTRGEAGEVDFARAQKDTGYYQEIMNNPALKKKYNEGLTDRLSSVL